MNSIPSFVCRTIPAVGHGPYPPAQIPRPARDLMAFAEVGLGV